MNRINVKQIINKCIIYYGFIGFAIGIIMFIVTLVYPTISYHVGEAEYFGFTAGILSLLSMPLIMGFVGFLHGFQLWYPIIAMLRYFKSRRK